MVRNIKESIAKQKKIQDERDRWKESPFKDVNDLKIDYSGKVGEDAVYEFIRDHMSDMYDVEYDGDKNINADDGTYDIKVRSKSSGVEKRIEVKTARIGTSSDNFQHEGLHNGVCDLVIFLDISFQDLYVTFIDLNSYDLRERHPILGTRPHARKETDNKFKFDTSLSSLSRGIREGITIKLDDDLERTIEFFNRFLSN